MAKLCEKCKKKLGFLGGYSYEDKSYCRDCYESIPKPKNYGKACRNCAYYGIDSNYNGFCKRDFNRYVDPGKNACDNFDDK